MPIYQYKCKTIVCPYCKNPYADQDAGSCCKETTAHGEPCDHEYEVFYASVTKAELEEPDERCESCGGKEKTRLISTGTSHILKGKWFKQGY